MQYSMTSPSPIQMPSSMISPQQLQSSMNSNFTMYANPTGNPMSKIKIDLYGLQQCLNNSSGDCINQHIQGLDNNTNSLQNLVKSVSGITTDSGGNIIMPQNFQNVEGENTCSYNSVNTIFVVVLFLFMVVLINNIK